MLLVLGRSPLRCALTLHDPYEDTREGRCRFASSTLYNALLSVEPGCISTEVHVWQALVHIDK